MNRNPCRYCFYGCERNGRYEPSYRGECYDCKNLKEHKKYLESQRKCYTSEEFITSLDELLKQEYVYVIQGVNKKLFHIAFVQNWQLQYVNNLINQKRIVKAILKRKPIEIVYNKNIKDDICE